MENTVVGELYSSFSHQEIKKLNKYLYHSNWKNSEFVIKCHNYLMLSKNQGSISKIKKNQLFKHIYGEDKISDSKLRFTMNRLVKAIKEFVLIDELNNDNIFSKKIWMDFIVSKRLKKNMIYSQNEQTDIKDSDYRYLYNYFKSQQSSVTEFSFTRNVENQYKSIKNVMENAAAFSDLVFLKNYCSLITFSSVYKSLPIEFPEQRLNEIRSKKYEDDYREFKVYISLVDLLIDSKKENYYKYKGNVFETLDVWSDKEKNNLLTYLVNYTSLQVNNGSNEFDEEQYNLYYLFEKEGIFSLKGYINHNKINNVVSTYLKKADFELAKSFVVKYIKLVNDENQESCLHFNMAKILFEQQEYKKSLRELLLVDFSKSAFYSLNSKVLLLKNYFELLETDGLDSLVLSFKEYIRKNKVISDVYKKSYMNFIKYTKKIYMQTPKKLMKIKVSVEEEKLLAERAWLIQKIES